MTPRDEHFKLARNILANCAKESLIEPGEYSPSDAKPKLNLLIAALRGQIEERLKTYDPKPVLTALISSGDALIRKRESETERVMLSRKHHVDYDRAESLVKIEAEFLQNHRCHRYLIEKSVSLRLAGTVAPSWEKILQTIALVDWLLVLYEASDSLHYDISPIAVTIEDTFLVTTKLKDSSEKASELFAHRKAGSRLAEADEGIDVLGILGADYPKKVDDAMIAFSGFSLMDLVAALEVLRYWPEYPGGGEVQDVYSIEGTVLMNILGTVLERSPDIISRIVSFLTLEADEVCLLLGDKRKTIDVPIWEHSKRPFRYLIRPLIRDGEGYLWGALSAYKAQQIWTRSLGMMTLPFSVPDDFEAVFEEAREKMGKALESKAMSILETFTPCARERLELHKADRAGKHPLDLGDYDAIAYHEETNTILYLECKEHERVFVLKDAKRLRERIFGRKGKSGGNVEKAEIRLEYWKKNFQKIHAALGWPTPPQPPEMIGLYMVREFVFWMQNPPRTTVLKFIELSTLRTFLSDVLRCESEA